MNKTKTKDSVPSNRVFRFRRFGEHRIFLRWVQIPSDGVSYTDHKANLLNDLKSLVSIEENSIFLCGTKAFQVLSVPVNLSSLDGIRLVSCKFLDSNDVVVINERQQKDFEMIRLGTSLFNP